jgi:hypothetical protein
MVYDFAAVAGRRQLSVKQARAVAHELPNVPKSVELEQRLARLELDAREWWDLLDRRLTALQARLDRLAAKIEGR